MSHEGGEEIATINSPYFVGWFCWMFLWTSHALHPHHTGGWSSKNLFEFLFAGKCCPTEAGSLSGKVALFDSTCFGARWSGADGNQATVCAPADEPQSEFGSHARLTRFPDNIWSPCTCCRSSLSADGTPINTAHTAQSSLFTSAERTRTRLAQELFSHFLCAWKESVTWSARVPPFVPLALVLVPRAHHFPYSLFLLPRHHNTHYNRDNTIYSKKHPVHDQPLEDLPVEKRRHQESLWREKPAECGNPRKTFSTGDGPKVLVSVSRISRITDPFQSYDAQKNLKSEITEYRRSERIWEKLGHTVLQDSKHQRRRTSTRTCTSTIPQKAFSKLESYQRRWLHHSMPRKLRGKPDALVVQEREVSAQLTQAGRESLRSHSSEGQKVFGETRCIVFIWVGKFDQEFGVQKRQPVESERISSWR